MSNKEATKRAEINARKLFDAGFRATARPGESTDRYSLTAPDGTICHFGYQFDEVTGVGQPAGFYQEKGETPIKRAKGCPINTMLLVTLAGLRE